ncbi:hypothetical protein JG688_00005559 [Phytophthora aleatoria]|uniref:Uncharacterized protein n=1 Tax=Phytophthora aleatoria TaxID=2496075 RepID=A0A8J5J8A6_9STRA|nr:hypothetical protein JG688_00005559 [Phytophthora aleatoria]
MEPLELELSPVQKKMAQPKSPNSVDASKSRRLPAEVRRARHRDRMQRQRLAEKNSIEIKRVEVERLTRELEHAIQRLSIEVEERKIDDGQRSETFPSLEEDSSLNLEGDKDDLWKGQSTAARLVQQRYLSLVLKQGSITEENRRLSERFRLWEKFIKLLGVEHERLPKNSINSEELLVPEGGAGRWVVFSEDEPVIFYQPIARNACLELAFITYQRMQEMLRGPGARKLYNEAFGWKVYFSMHEDKMSKVRMQHRFTKRISAIDANGERVTGDTLAKATWKIISTPELYSQMYRSPMTSKMLQHVDAHTSVMMRTFPDANAVMRMRFVCLVVQVQDCVIDENAGVNGKNDTRRRVTMLTSILDPDKCFPRASTHTPSPMAEWMREGMSYLSFTEIDEENSVEIEYGGLTNVDSETASCTGLPFVTMNMGEALVRWEQLVTPMRTLSITEK